MSLKEYAKKRDFSATPEPKGKVKKGKPRKLMFVIQKHKATRLHYDFRLEIEGTLKSWAVPKGPSYNPGEKRLAVQVEDHPIDYGDFEGIIPEGNYGAGTVIVWDKGTYDLTDDYFDDPLEAWRQGKLHILLHGKKLKGTWILVRTKGSTSKDWLLFKKNDDDADPGSDITEEQPESVKSGKTIEDLEKKKGARQWNTPIETQLENLDVKEGDRKPMPRHIAPMLATLVDEPFDSPQWMYELKYDGVRAMAYKTHNSVRMLSRNDLEMRDRFPEIADALAQLPVNEAILDGEIVAMDEGGRTSFQLLQPRMHLRHRADIEKRMEEIPVYFFVFDLLYCNGYLLTKTPLWKRKEILRTVLANIAPSSAAAGRLLFSDHVEEDGRAFHRAAGERGLEGILAKEKDSFYESRRSRQWLKIRCALQQEFVVVGYTEPHGSRKYFGSLLLGLYDGRPAETEAHSKHSKGQGGTSKSAETTSRDNGTGLLFVGSSGGGFDTATLKTIHSSLKNLETTQPPVLNPPRLKGAHWVKPQLVAQVRFTEWTQEGIIRHPVFLGLREDKDPKSCRREVEVDAGDASRIAERDTAAATEPGSKSSRRGRRSDSKPAGRSAAKTARRTAGDSSAGSEENSSDDNSPASTKKQKRAARKPEKIKTKKSSPDAAPSKSDPAPFKTKHSIAFSNLDKVLWPEDGYTKHDLISFYDKIAPFILPHLKDRPLNLERFPDGIHGESFYQKNTPDYFPDWIPRERIHSPDSPNKYVNYTICNDRDALLYLANLACIPHNPWSSRVRTLDKPDFILFDLDPEQAPFSQVREVALKLHELLEEIGLDAYPKVSGATGMHILAPLKPQYSYDDARQFAQVVGMLLLHRYPDLVTLERVVKKRKGKVYVDFLQNRKGQTVVGPYVLRPRPGAPVATPVTWKEVAAKDLDPSNFNMKNIFARLDKIGDVFEPVLKNKQLLAKPLANLEKFAEEVG
ncbi:MAG TPA: non-homologous end-joining DNA ligase [Acidobacteriota bacterium]